jgi:hypothetical protein
MAIPFGYINKNGKHAKYKNGVAKVLKYGIIELL